MKFPTLAVLSHVFLAGCASALFAAPAAAQEPEARAAESGSGFAETAEPFLARYCVRCHGPRQQKGGLRLDTLSHDFGDLDSSETWRQVFYRVRFDEMPPRSTRNQPSADDKQAMLGWIDDQLIAEGRGIHLAEKMRLPQFGNYVDHAQLFSGEVDEPPYTDARLWRQRPQIYADLW
ncbi:MAG: hypothetical protein O3B85_15870, partial [Planctomycetota bacterium]|nr:hypothetical protein [Planctomycetota bacterium]